MALIYNRILTHFSGLNSVALNASGDLAAACFNDRELLVCRIIEGPRKIDPSEIVNPKLGGLEEGGSLEEYRFIRLPPPSRHNRPLGAKVYFEHTKLAFLNDEILLVAREIEQVGGGRSPPPSEEVNISLAAVKIETGDVVAEFTDSSYGPLYAAPLLIPPKYGLFPAGHTAICLDTTSFREVFRLRTFDENEAVIGEKGVPSEEHICHNAVAYDPPTGILYVLWREYGASFLQTYRLHPEEGSFERLQRRSVYKGELEGVEANSLCLRPDGKEVAVWGTDLDGLIDCPSEKGMKVPEPVRFGRLGMFSKKAKRFLDVHLKIHYGVDEYGAKPFYLDDHTVVINTPGGVLVGVDTISGKSDPLMEEWCQIEDLSVHHEKRLLLVATKGKAGYPGGLTLLGLA
jgi:hypothetical protein